MNDEKSELDLYISKIEIRRVENDVIKAIVKVELNNYIFIRDIRIILVRENLEVIMPTKKIEGIERYEDIYYPFTSEFRDYLCKKILDVYTSGKEVITFDETVTQPKIDVKVNLTYETSGIVANVKFIINDCFCINEIRLLKMREKNEYILVFPFRRKNNGEIVDMVIIKEYGKYKEIVENKYFSLVKEIGEERIIQINGYRKQIKNETINLGILGEFLIRNVGCNKFNEEPEEKCYEFIRDVMKKYNQNIDVVNNKIMYEIYDELVATAYPIWECEAFSKIIDEDKLPVGFENLTEKEKKQIVYKEFDYNEKNIIEKLNQNVPFLNVDKLKNDIQIANVSIDSKLNELSIEFDGICDFFCAYIALDYNDNFEVIEFQGS